MQKKHWIFLLIFSIVLILIAFAPLAYSQRVAESQISNHLQGQTLRQSTSSVWEFFNEPQYIVLERLNDQDIKASFITLQRDWLLTWQVKELQTVLVTGGDRQLEELKKAVQEGRLTSEQAISYQDLSDENRDTLQQHQEKNKVGSVLQSIGDPQGKHILEIRTGLEPNFNEVFLNNKYIGLNNVLALEFDSAGENLYYSTFKIDEAGEGHSHEQISSKKIFKYNINTEQISEVVDISEVYPISFKISSKFILLAQGSGRSGPGADFALTLINLTTKQGSSVQLGDIFPSDKNLQYTNDYNLQVLDLNSSSALLQVSYFEQGQRKADYYELDIAATDLVLKKQN